MIRLLILVYLISTMLTGNADHAAGGYDAWAGPGLHLMISDNGTPDIYDDDFITDWEDNRAVTVFVWDR